MKRHFLLSLVVCLLTPLVGIAATIRDYGAKGDGGTDDTGAIQNAINAVGAGTLVFPAGEYKVGSTLKLVNGATYQGQAGAILKGPGGKWLMQTPNSPSKITITGLTLDNGGLNIAGTASDLTITNNTFQNLTSDNSGGNWTLGTAVFAGSGIRNSKISGNTFKNLLTQQNVPSSDIKGNQGMMFYGIDNTSIDHNTFDRMVEGMHICFTNTYPSSNVYIGHNNFTAIHRMGMEIQGPYGCGNKPSLPDYDTKDMVIEYNSFTKPLSPYWWTYPISLANPDGGHGSGGTGAIIRYNYIVSAIPSYGMDGYNGYGIEAGDSNMQIYGNTVVGPWGTAIIYDGSPNSTIHDNWMCGLAAGATVGIRWETKQSSNVSIKDNTIYPNTCPTSNYPNPITSTASNSTTSVTNGTYTIKNMSSGMLLDDPAFSVQSGAQMIQWEENGGANQKWALALDQNGYYTIANTHSGLYLTDASGKLTQGLRSGADSQLWQFQTAGSGVYMLINKATGRAADNPRSVVEAGTGLISWPVTNGLNQKWQLQQ